MSRGRNLAPLFRNRYRVPSARLKNWDYRRPGVYFLTICTLWRDPCLGEVAGGEVTLSDYGKIVARRWEGIPFGCSQATLDAWIVMPDHLHGIVIFGSVSSESEPVSLATVIG
jgi:putative transposase